MAGVSEASAIIGLAATAAHLSMLIIEVGHKYKNAKVQIESFGRELGILSKILDQLRRLLSQDALHLDMSFHVLTTEIVDECSEMFSQLNTFKEKLYDAPSSHNPSWRGKTKWVFEAAELEYLRARVDSMKVNLLLMMTFQTINGQRGGSPAPKSEEQSNSIRLLTIQSNACVQRLQKLEEDMAIMGDANGDLKGSEMSTKTFETADSVRSFRDSIISLYDRTPYGWDMWSNSQTSFLTAQESQDIQMTVTETVEDYLNGAPIHTKEIEGVQDEGPDSLTAVNIAGASPISYSVSQDRFQSVLCLDGGGVRTYSTLIILRQLMAEIALAEYLLAKENPTPTPQLFGSKGDWIPKAYKQETFLNYQPCDYFDYIAGASTGGLAAIMLGRLRMSIKSCLKEFSDILESMFNAHKTTSIKTPLYWRQPKYDHQAFEVRVRNLVQLHDLKFEELFRDGVFGSDPSQVRTIAVACLRCAGPPYMIPYLFRSYDHLDARSEDNKTHTPTGSLPTWQVARALLAAPGYFSPIKIGDHEFSGHSKELRNPSLPVLQEVTQMLDCKLDTYTLLVSIGSGSFRAPKSDNKESLPDTWQMGDTSTNVKLKGKGYTYHRLNPGSMLNNVKYDEWKKIKGAVGNATIDRITYETETYLEDPSVRENLRAIALSLVQKRRACSERKNLERYNSLSNV